MLDNKFVLLLITFVWMSGLFAIGLTLASMLQDRREHFWDEGYTFRRPRILAPLYGSLATFCFGLALHAYATQGQISLWIAIVWAVLAVSFLARVARIFFIGAYHGWNTQLSSRLVPQESARHEEQTIQTPIWLSITVLLLLVNLYFLGRWGGAQNTAGGLAKELAGVVQAESTIVPSPIDSTGEQNVTHITAVERIPRSTTGAPAAPTASATVELSEENRLLIATATPHVQTEVVTTVDTTATESISLVDDITTAAVTSTAITISTTALIKETPAVTTPVVATPVVATPVAISFMVENSRGANVRTAPSLAADIITALPNATIGIILGRTGDNQWFYVRLLDGGRGWVSSQVAQPSEMIDLVPVIDTK